MTHVITLSLVSFFLHLVWEYGQCSAFFVHGSVPSTHQAMVLATLGDVAITWILYSLLALRNRRWLWSLDRWWPSDFLILLVLALVVGVIIEARALSTGRWGYTSSNPMVPGTNFSALPLLQMMLLTPIGLWIAKRLTQSDALKSS